MKKIENFILPEHTNTLYEREAVSSISLTKDVAKKINELVNAYNELAKLDLEWKQTQEGAIRKAVVYMKDNLLNSLNDLMVLLRDSGFIDDRIEYHCGELKSRLDNLLGNITEGSTTLDSEVIDIRYGSGITYDTAGDSVREQINGVKKQLAILFNSLNVDEVVPFSLSSGYIDNSLSIHTPKHDQKEVTTDFIDVTDNGVYQIKTYCDIPEEGKQWIGVTYYDKNKTPYQRTSEENITDKTFIKPDDRCCYIRVSARTYGNGVLLVFKKNFSNVHNTLPIYQHKYNYEYIRTNFTLGYFNSAGEFLTATPHGAEVYSDLIPVVGGERYVVISNAENPVGIVGNHAEYLWGAVAFYDVEGNYLYRPYTFTVNEEREDKKYSFVGEFSVPAGVGYIRVCSRTYWNGSVNIAKVVNPVIDNVGTSLAMSNNSFNIRGIAHRGLSAMAPENTLQAYREAKKGGFYYVECDVRFTADNQAVLLHDSTIDRTSNGTGNISSMTLSEVRGLDFGSWFSPSYTGEKIPTFEEFIILCKKLGLHPYIELKAGTEAQITNLIATVKKYDMLRSVTWIGGNPYITYIHNVDKKASIGIVVESVTNANIVEATRIKTDDNYIFMNAHTFTEAEIKICQDNEIPLSVWTINDTDTILNLDGYISGVTSDSLNAGVICSNYF